MNRILFLPLLYWPAARQSREAQAVLDLSLITCQQLLASDQTAGFDRLVDERIFQRHQEP